MLAFLKRYHLPALLICVSTLINGCTGTKNTSEGTYLFGGGEIKIASKIENAKKKEVHQSLKDLMHPSPNGKFLWMRPALSLHNSIKKPKKEKGIKHWLKYKLGKPPVMYDETVSQRVQNSIVNQLFHKGYFDAECRFEEQQKKKVTFITYYVETGSPHTIDTLIIPYDSSFLGKALHNQKGEPMIYKGENYDLEKLKAERARLKEEVADQGFYFFDTDYFYFNADSSSTHNKVSLKIKVKSSTPKEAFYPYSLNKIYVVEDYNLQDSIKKDTTFIDGYYFLSSRNATRPEIVLDEVFLESGNLYNGNIHAKTIRYLMALGNYRYANIQYFNQNDSSRTLDANVLLTPQSKYSISAELNTVVKTNNFFGPGARLNFLNRNFLKGSEILSTNLSGSFEWQNANNYNNTSMDLVLETSLIIPRIVIFNQNKEDKKYLANSRVTGGVGYYNRVNLYKFMTFSGSFKYSWVKRPRITHELLPFDVSLSNLLETSPEFNDYLEENPSVRRSLENQFILGTTYNFTYNALKDKNFLYTGGIEFAGNSLSLIASATGNPPDKEDPNKFIGVPYSQFIRLKNEFVYHAKLKEGHVLASRLIASIGIPYGNSTVLPYIRQFFAGGSNSIRAFSARSVGPGSYIPTDTASYFLVDQSGDIKLEANLEYRFPIIKYLKGALFVDAGNVWLINNDPNRLGGEFDVDNFLSELAIGVGYGLRIDMDILVIGFDWAFPIRKPYLPEGNRWNDIEFFDPDWRKKNMILNISIGYPF